MHLIDTDATIVQFETGFNGGVDHHGFAPFEGFDDVIQVSVGFLRVHLFIMTEKAGQGKGDFKGMRVLQ